MEETQQREKTHLEKLEDLAYAVANNNGINRSADLVNKDIQTYVREGNLDEEGLASMMWLFVHAKEQNLKSWDDVGKLISYSGSAISRIYAGKYAGNLDNVIEKIESYRHIFAEREKMSNDTFIETSIWERVRNVCDLSLTRNAPVRIVGVSQIGKTHALLEYKRRAKFNVIYSRVPAAPSFRVFMRAIATAAGVNSELREEQLRSRIPGALNRQTLLIVDELHELALSAGRGTAMKCMEWLREVYDTSRCGLAVCGTKSMEDDLIQNAGLRGWLDQFDQRCIRRLVLPVRLPETDIALAAAAYGFPIPDKSVEGIFSSIRMNRLCACLNMASGVAARKGAPKTWDLFRAVYKKNFGGEQ